LVGYVGYANRVGQQMASAWPIGNDYRIAWGWLLAMLAIQNKPPTMPTPCSGARAAFCGRLAVVGYVGGFDTRFKSLHSVYQFASRQLLIC